MITIRSRLEELDIMRAFAIICIVMGHAGGPGSEYSYPFHVAVFFLVSGYLYSSRHSYTLADVLKNVKSKIERLWFPYFFWNTIFILLNNFFLDINFYTDEPTLRDYLYSIDVPSITHLHEYMDLKEMLFRIVKSVLFRSSTTMGGAMWFLGTLFFISVLYICLDWLIRKLLKKDPWIIQTVIATVFIVIGQKLSYETELFGMNRVLSCYMLYHLGFSMKKGNVMSLFKTKLHHIFLGCGAMLILLVAFQIEPGYCVDLWANYYPSVPYLIVISLCGWSVSYSIAYFIKNTPVRNILVLIGNNTMSVMIFHYMFFKIIAFIIVKVYDLPDFCLATQTHIYGDRGIWWLAYSIVGLAGPILLYEVHKKVMKLITPKPREALPAEK